MSTVQHDILTVRSANLLLASLPLDDYARIAPHLRSLPMKLKQTLQRQGEPIQYVIFPTGGSCSLVKTLENGQSAEVAMIGAEGAVGAEIFFGQRIAAYEVLVQASARSADAIAADVFTTEMNRRGALFNRIIRYHQALMSQLMQTVACNGLHSVEQRCARWLLMTRDRVQNDEFPVTHDLLAMMLGVRRPTVTLVIAALERQGLVAHGRGQMRILDRQRLESVSCECYRTVKTVAGRLLPELAHSMA